MFELYFYRARVIRNSSCIFTSLDFIVLFDSKKIFHFDQQRIFVLSFFNKRSFGHSRKVNIKHATGRKMLTYLDNDLFFFFFSSFFFFFFCIFFSIVSHLTRTQNSLSDTGSRRGRIHEWNISQYMNE